MLRTHQYTLRFPKLVFIEEVNFKSWSDKKKTEVYRLDWSYKEQQDTETPEFPYNDLVRNQLFAIPRKYLEHINHCASTSLIEWNKNYPFDTMIREICLEPAMAYIGVAFKLLCDCAYDKEANAFDRRPTRRILTSACLYKFWLNQTGMGLVENRAEFDNLKSSINLDPFGEETRVIEEYLLKMSAFTQQCMGRLPAVPLDEATGSSIEVDTLKNHILSLSNPTKFNEVVDKIAKEIEEDFTE